MRVPLIKPRNSHQAWGLLRILVTAKWVVDYQGVPFELTIQPREVAVYDEEAAILHIKNQETGHSRTFTPTVKVTIDHDPAHPHFEVEFATLTIRDASCRQ